jgi:hypothetical protein
LTLRRRPQAQHTSQARHTPRLTTAKTTRNTKKDHGAMINDNNSSFLHALLVQVVRPPHGCVAIDRQLRRRRPGAAHDEEALVFRKEVESRMGVPEVDVVRLCKGPGAEVACFPRDPFPPPIPSPAQRRRLEPQQITAGPDHAKLLKLLLGVGIWLRKGFTRFAISVMVRSISRRRRTISSSHVCSGSTSMRWRAA